VQATLTASQARLKAAGEQLKNTADENKALKEELERLKKANAKPMKGNKAAQLMGDYSKYIYITTEKLSKWLTRNLKVFREWWEDCVISKLSNEQVMYATDGHFNSLDDFDLAALLRILSKNWKRLKKYNFMPDSAKDNLDQMFEVRNRWAHFNSTPPSKDDMVGDLAVISEFLSFLNCDREILQEVSRFAEEVEKMEI